MGIIVTDQAQKLWRILNGVLCIYKPKGVSSQRVRSNIVLNLSEDLCSLNTRPPIEHVFIEGDPQKALSVKVEPSYADHPLVTGPRYLPEDIRCIFVTHLGKNTSGVSVFGINKGIRMLKSFSLARISKAYHIYGQLGYSTDNNFSDGKIVEKSKFHHVHEHSVLRLLAAIQASHQRYMYENTGLDIQSQTVADLACEGLIRPSEKTGPILYSIRCVHFNPPDFSLEVVSVHENENYFGTLIHEIGMKLRTNATCTGVHCIRHGPFTLEHALLSKHWHLQEVFDNMKICRDILQKQKNFREISAKIVSEDNAENQPSQKFVM